MYWDCPSTLQTKLLPSSRKGRKTIRETPAKRSVYFQRYPLAAFFN
jgi:hypothetical protein